MVLRAIPNVTVLTRTAPEITAEVLDRYTKLIREMPNDMVRFYIEHCRNCFLVWKRCESLSYVTYPPLAVIEEMKELFKRIEDPEIRDMANHFLWYVVEFSLGREPMTNELLNPL